MAPPARALSPAQSKVLVDAWADADLNRRANIMFARAECVNAMLALEVASAVAEGAARKSVKAQLTYCYDKFWKAQQQTAGIKEGVTTPAAGGAGGSDEGAAAAATQAAAAAPAAAAPAPAVAAPVAPVPAPPAPAPPAVAAAAQVAAVLQQPAAAMVVAHAAPAAPPAAPPPTAAVVAQAAAAVAAAAVLPAAPVAVAAPPAALAAPPAPPAAVAGNAAGAAHAGAAGDSGGGVGADEASAFKTALSEHREIQEILAHLGTLLRDDDERKPMYSIVDERDQKLVFGGAPNSRLVPPAVVPRPAGGRFIVKEPYGEELRAEEQRALRALMDASVVSDGISEQRARLRDVDVAWLSRDDGGGPFKLCALLEVEHSTLKSGSGMMRLLDVCWAQHSARTKCVLIVRDADAALAERLLRSGAWKDIKEMLEKKRNASFAVIWQSWLLEGYTHVARDKNSMTLWSFISAYCDKRFASACERYGTDDENPRRPRLQPAHAGAGGAGRR
jgi:hypothetical protein